MADPKKPVDEEADLTSTETDASVDAVDMSEQSQTTDDADMAADDVPDEDADHDDGDPDMPAPHEETLLDQVSPDSTPAPEPDLEPAPAEPVQKSGAGFGAMALGGLVAAAIGIGAAKFILPQSWLTDQSGAEALTSTVQAQEKQIASLTTNISDLSETVQDQSGTEALAAQIGEMSQSITGRLDKLSEDVAAQGLWLGEVDTRLTELEKAPLQSSGNAAVAAYERELEQMRAALQQQREQNDEIAASVSSVAEKARADIDAASERAQMLETRAAMLRVQAALETGGSFSGALAELGVDAPEALAASADSGVATLPDLQAGFPAAARDALQASLHATAGDDPTNRVSAFLRGQLGVRSLAPREGDDPDAILSRAQAAVTAGEIEGALAEIVMLPPDGQSAMTDWVTAARARLDALAAASGLAETLNIN